MTLYFFLAYILGSPSKSKPKKTSRRSRRQYKHYVRREVKRYNRRRRSPSHPRIGRDYPFRLRRRGIYNYWSQAPTHLDQTVMNMLRELRFEFIQSNRNDRSTRRPSSQRLVKNHIREGHAPIVLSQTLFNIAIVSQIEKVDFQRLHQEMHSCVRQ